MRMRTTLLSVVATVCFVLVLAGPATADWPYWLGPNFTGVSGEKNLPDQWNPQGGEGSNVLWAREVSVRSTPTVMNGRMYILTNSYPEDEKKAGEKVVCLNAETGETHWEYEFNVYLSDVPIERVGWSSVVCDPESGNVYALGVCGYFCCLNGETGDLVWDRSLHEEFGVLSTYGGRTNHPIIHENHVLISGVVIGWGEMAKPAHRFLCFDKTNGVPVWFRGTRLLPEDTTYSAPVIAAIDGELQMIFGSGDGGIYSFQPRTGKMLWKYMVSGRGINTAPLVVGNRVYCGHGEENLDTTEMGAIYCIDATQRGDITKSGEIWRKTGYFVGRSSPIMIEGRLYFADDRAKLHCLNPDNGEALGKPVPMGTMMRSSLLYADGKIFANETNGRGYILTPTETGADISYRYRFQRGEEAHGSPIAVNGRVYIPTTGNLYCIGLPDAERVSEPLPELPQETFDPNDNEPTQVIVAPVESLLYPGDRQPMQVRLYNTKGQFVRMAQADEIEWSHTGPGAIDADGRYSIGADHAEQAALIVTAKVGELTGEARIRVVPELPWSFDFSDGKIPETWVGASYRHVPLDFDLLMKLKADDQMTSDLYIYFMTEFTNFAPMREFDDSTPQQRWTALLDFIDLANSEHRPRTIEDGQAKLGAALQRLIDEKVLATAEWSNWERKTADGTVTLFPKLTITQGERKIDGNGVMCKITTIPKGTRSQGWMGHPDFHNYTVQTDVYAFSRKGKLPDIGVIAQRYTLDMMGASQQLQLRTWTPQLNRFSVNVPFTWEADKWYTVKFQASTEDGKAVLRAKVWERDSDEPSEWTITGTDEHGNLIGSPGLFGNAKDGEIFYDNLAIRRNE